MNLNIKKTITISAILASLSAPVYAVDFEELANSVDTVKAKDSVDGEKLVEAVSLDGVDLQKANESVDKEKAIDAVDLEKAQKALTGF